MRIMCCLEAAVSVLYSEANRVENIAHTQTENKKSSSPALSYIRLKLIVVVFSSAPINISQQR